MTYSDLTLIQAYLLDLVKNKELEVNELRKLAEKDPTYMPKLTIALGKYCRLQNLTDGISHDLTNLQGSGPGNLFARESPKSAQLRATESVAEELSKINDTLSRIVTYG